MTAFISAVFDGDRLEILSDGATYTDDGHVLSFSTKVRPIADLPAATMTRGCAETGEIVHELVAKVFSLAKTFDQGIDFMQRVTRGDAKAGWETPVQCVIWGISEKHGPMTFWFATADVHNGDGRWKLMSTSEGFYQGEPCVWPAEYLASGTLADKAVTLMQQLRREPHNDLLTGQPHAGSNHAIVGGHIDLTTISASGVSQRRLHTWPDRVGERMITDPSTVDLGSRKAYQEGLAALAKAFSATKHPEAA